MKNRNFINKIAITGVMGAGKSTVGLILKNYGMSFISVDILAHQAIASHSPGYLKLLQLLGKEYLEKEGHFNTEKIAKSVFRDKDMLHQVESVIHPIIWKLLKKEEESLLLSGQKLVFYEIPLLFEKKWENLFDIKVVIAINSKKQQDRLKENRNWSIKEINSRMQFQMPQSDKIEKADYVIWNNSSLEELEKQVFSLISHLDLVQKED